MRGLMILSCLLSSSLQAQVPTVKAQAESAPIPAGFGDSDDAAIWLNPKDPEKSLILGTSKYDEDGMGGLGIYSLDGREKQFFSGSKLNSVDLLGDLAVASNRSEKALDFYQVKDGRVVFLSRTELFDAAGEAFEPYGLCLRKGKAGGVHIYLPTKSGTLFHYIAPRAGEVRLRDTLHFPDFVSKEEDERIRSYVTKETLAEGEEEELEENLKERFILEGCVFDEKTQKLYVGMENLGVFSIDLKKKPAKPELVIPVQGSWTDIETWQKHGKPRVTDDIEGLDILHAEEESYLIFSSQGISEFSVFELESMAWRGNFKVSFGAADEVTLTDGLALKAGYFGKNFPNGLLIVHDDENTEDDGSQVPANYKFVSLEDVWKLIPDSADLSARQQKFDR